MPVSRPDPSAQSCKTHRSTYCLMRGGNADWLGRFSAYFVNELPADLVGVPRSMLPRI
jgi:hypothetical protein